MRATRPLARMPSSPSADGSAGPTTFQAAGRTSAPILAVATVVAAAALVTLAVLAAGWPGGPAAQASDGSSPQWRPQSDPVSSTVDLYGVSFADHERGLAVGGFNTVQLTVDGGNTWTPQPFPEPENTDTRWFRDVVFAESAHAVIVEAGGVVWTSPDGGRNWTERYVCESTNPCEEGTEDRVTPNLRTVTMVEAPSCPEEQPRCHGWAAGGRMDVFHTTDGGKNWTQQDVPSQGGGVANTINASKAIRDVSFVDHTTGWALAANGAVFRTDDGGETWSQTTGDKLLTSHRLEVQAMHFVDEETGWIVGKTGTDPTGFVISGVPGRGVIWHTEDGGDTWVQQDHPAPGVRQGERGVYGFNDVDFVGRERGYVVGGYHDSDGLVYVTDDGGETWTRQPTGLVFEFKAVDFAGGPGCSDEQPRCHGWVAGFYGHGRGAIGHTDDGGGDWLPQVPGLSAFEAVSAVDDQHARLVATPGVTDGVPGAAVLATGDGGENWTAQDLDVDADNPRLNDVACKTPKHCHAVGFTFPDDDALVVHTENGGESWERQDLGADAGRLRAVACSDPEHCHVVGYDGLVFRTDDGGQSWQRQHACEGSTGSACDADSDDRVSAQLQSVVFRDAHQEGIIVGNGATILTTDDGGKTLTPRAAPVDDPLRDVACHGNGQCLAVGGKFNKDEAWVRRGDCGVVLASGDGGASWTVVKRSGSCDGDDNGEAFTAVACGAGDCRVAGTGGTMIVSAHGDGSWDPVDVPSSRMFSGLDMAGGRAWAASDTADVYSTYHPPGPVRDLAVEAVDGSTAEVRWEAPSRDGAGIPAPPAADYEVRLAASPITADTFEDATPCSDCGEFDPQEIGDEVTATVEGLEPGTQQFVAVRAVDDADFVGPVRTAGVQLPDDVVPGRVSDLAATALAATSVELSWSAPASNGDSGPPVRRFHIGQAREPITAKNFDDTDHTDMLCSEAGCQLPAPDAVGDEFTLPVEDLTSDTDYHYAVRPVDAAGNTGTVSNSASVTTLVDGSAPARVQDLTASAVSPTEITLSWSVPDDGGGAPAGRFVIKQRQSGGFVGEDDFADAFALCGGACVFDPAQMGERLELTVTDLTPAATYSYALKAVDPSGNTGPRSNTAQATTPDGAGSGPAGADDAQQPSTGDDAPAGVEAAAEGVVRVSGADRIATAVAASREAFAAGQAEAAVVARADDFADGLAGVPLAAAENGPLLLTHSGRLDERVAGELNRVLADGARVFVLGGRAALADSVEARIADLGFEPVRLAGASRFETAAVIAEDGLGAPDEVLFATGGDFADAVTAGAAAARREAAVLLSAGDRLPAATADYRDRHPAGAEWAVGGPAARAVPQATPLVGATRFETAAVVADELFTDPATVGVATGLAFPDALSGGAHIAAYSEPMLLSGPDQLHPAAGAYLTAQAPTIETAIVYGGPAALADAVADQTSAAITGDS